jgi:DNA replication protein DnaC
MPHADWLGLLIDREVTFRDNRRLARRLSAAKLRQTATIENIDSRTSRGLDRALFQAPTTSQWVREHNHLAIVGPTGTGSLGSPALGNKACRDGFSVLYKRTSRLFADLAQRRAPDPPDDHVGAHQSPHHRRLGARTARRRAAPRSSRDRR